MSLKIDFLKNNPHITEICAQWGLSTWGHYNENAHLEGYIKRYALHQQEGALPLTMLAFMDNQPVGMASLRETDGLKPILKPWLGSLYVKPEHRSQGIGAKLVGSIEDQAKKLGYSILHLLVFDPKICEWYGTLGWTIIGFDTYNNHDVTVMSKKLG